MRRLRFSSEARSKRSQSLVDGRNDLQFHGWSVREDASPAGSMKLNLRHGGKENQYHALAYIEVDANGIDHDGPWPIGLDAPLGIWSDMENGEGNLIVYYSLAEGNR